MDIELAIEAIDLAPTLDHIVLFSGDGDFVPLVRSLQLKGKRVSVVSTLETTPAMVSDDLRRQADQFIELDHILKVVGRPASERVPRSPLNGASDVRN
jgi:uncharacterized LabA/DUF88 family protein